MNTFRICVKLPENYSNILETSIIDEMEKACRKWDVELVPDEREKVANSAMQQLFDKASHNFGNIWKGGQEVFINIDTHSEKLEHNSTILRQGNGFIESTEPDHNNVPVSELGGYLCDLISSWVRTAVFYGVGSYS